MTLAATLMQRLRVGADALQAVLGAQDRRCGAVRQRRAHRQRDRVGDGRRGQHLVDGEGLAELRVRVVHRVLVVLGAHRRDLPLRRAVGLHVPAAERRVDRHELAVRPVRLGAGRRRDAFAHLHQRGVVLLDARDVPAALEDREGLRLVGNVHLLGADGERHVRGAGLEALHREIERRAARGAGVLDVVDGDALDADLAEDDLAGDRDLSLQRAVGHARVVGDADLRRRAAGVREGADAAPRRRGRRGCARGAGRTRSWRCRRRRSGSRGLLAARRGTGAGLAGDPLQDGRVGVGHQPAQPEQRARAVAGDDALLAALDACDDVGGAVVG